MIRRYRGASGAVVALAVLSAVCGGLGWWRAAWVSGSLALALAQVAAHYGGLVTVRGVDTVLRRVLKGQGVAVSASADPEAKELLVNLAAKMNEQQALEQQTLRQVAAEARLLRLQGEARRVRGD